jgi:predicted kinase
MPKLYVMCGISGSGKSTYAKSIQSSVQKRPIIVSTDELRAMLCGNASDQTDPELIFNTAYSMIQTLLERDYDVIFDAMNLTARARKDLINRFLWYCNDGVRSLQCVG